MSNELTEYFTSLKWDGVSRLDNWLRDYCGCNNDDSDYVSAVGRKWLCAAVKRVLNPGEKFDHMLILVGDQGTGKSTLLKELATINGMSYFNDAIDFKSFIGKNEIVKLQDSLIIEVTNIKGISKKYVNELERQISTCNDEVILKYENKPTIYPRKFVFAGTLNSMNGFLLNQTSYKRFWPVLTKKFDIKGLKAAKEQLWAEAVYAVSLGEKLYLGDSK